MPSGVVASSLVVAMSAGSLSGTDDLRRDRAGRDPEQIDEGLRMFAEQRS
jgi:hypothetical protein